MKVGRTLMCLIGVGSIVFTAGCTGVCIRVSTVEDEPGRYAQTFDSDVAINDFTFSDPAAWRHGSDGENGWIELFAQSDYTPPHRSPINIGLLKGRVVDSFTLSADLMQTGRDYGHRDMCIFFGYRSSAKYMYIHMSTEADENAHQVFVVDGSPRTPITTSRTDGVDWGTGVWRAVRIAYDDATSTVQVYFDDELVLTSDRVPWSGGLIGFGSFDDEGRVDNIELAGERVELDIDTRFPGK